ncbi:MAG: glycogen/starch/alpha-glucan phosphorylase [Oscillospiraceae bacterium]|nr:glycogen/starch/alpha-glucan phosphorylase [Oscillospiraceae bacterium]
MVTNKKYNDSEQLFSDIEKAIKTEYGVAATSATIQNVYFVLGEIVRNILSEMRAEASLAAANQGAKEVYYLSMEFLIGKSLHNNLTYLGMEDIAREAVNKCGISLEQLYDLEPDAGLGNGGLGRLAACYLDGLATCNYPATGYSLLYEYGIFKQKIEEGKQIELPDAWLPYGRVWLEQRSDEAVEVRFGGQVLSQWYGKYYHAEQVNYDVVRAVPYDMFISGYDSPSVSKLRLWKAESPGIDMESFNRGDYAAAMLKNSTAELITKILYPNDNQVDGKLLRLRQQYFLCCASMQDLISKHLARYDGNLDLLPEKVAIHVNDTHPTLAIPEMMRILLDECGYGWDKAFDIVRRCFAYTNHTLMSEALERWNAELVKTCIPRVYEIIQEIDRTLEREMAGCDPDTLSKIRIIHNGEVRMANLCAFVSHNVNGVSKLHSDLVKTSLFKDFADRTPEKFVNVTNGIAYRRWLLEGNKGLSNYISSLIGEGFKKDASRLSDLLAYSDNHDVLAHLNAIKYENKKTFIKYAGGFSKVALDPEAVFDVQVKRFHEYKRQHMNALAVVRRYLDITNGNGFDYIPRVFFFGGKAAPGYFMAKEMIHFVCVLSDFLEKDERTKDTLRVVFLPDFRVSMSEVLMPAADISEQISLAGTEASGTGNMKLMLNGAVTIGTLDGANVEIRNAAGEDNFFLFGMTKEQVLSEQASYNPNQIYQSNAALKEVFEFIESGALGYKFPELLGSLKSQDRYMVLRDFDDYYRAQLETDKAYADRIGWARKSLANIATSGIFSADRSVTEYADTIWKMEPLV